MSANPAVWPCGTPRSQGNAFTWERTPAPVVSDRTLRRREQAATSRVDRQLAKALNNATYRATEKGRIAKAKARANAKAKRNAGLVPIPSQDVLAHAAKQKTKPAGGSFRTI